jgi:peroxiredoxin
MPAGTQLPKFTIGTPGSPQTQKYLGLKDDKPFTLSEIGAKLVVIEFFNSFWPICHKNAPVVNRLYNVIEGDAGLAKDIRMMGIGIADSQKRVDAFRTAFHVLFPLFPDEKGAIFMLVGKPDTPTMIITTPGGKVLMSHVGFIEDFDGLLKEIREIDKKQ